MFFQPVFFYELPEKEYVNSQISDGYVFRTAFQQDHPVFHPFDAVNSISVDLSCY
jgi:hypothetical protein